MIRAYSVTGMVLDSKARVGTGLPSAVSPDRHSLETHGCDSWGGAGPDCVSF